MLEGLDSTLLRCFHLNLEIGYHPGQQLYLDIVVSNGLDGLFQFNLPFVNFNAGCFLNMLLYRRW